MTLRKTLAFVLLGAVALAPCLGVCAGWMASAHARMACCADKTADEATMCCASSEGRQNAESLTSLSVVAVPAIEPVAVKITSVPAPSTRNRSVLDAHAQLTDESARHVLLSVFLI